MTLTPWLARAAQLTTLATALTALPGLCAAQASAAATPVSAAKKELVQKLLTLQQSSYEGLARTLTEQPVSLMGQQASAILQSRVAPEKREAVAKEIQAEFQKYGSEVGPMVRDRTLKAAPGTIGPILEEKLTEDELKQTIAALESPGFKKFMQLGAEMQRALGQKMVAELQPSIDPKLKALEQAVTQKLNAVASGAASAPKVAAAPKAAASAKK